jgi:hypothetical protein
MVKLNCENSDDVKTIKDVLYVPGLTTNLSSVSKMARKELIVTFSQQGCRLCDQDGCAVQGEVRVTGSNLNGIYKVDMSQEMVHVAASEKKMQRIWQRRLDQLCRKSMLLLPGGVASGILR